MRVINQSELESISGGMIMGPITRFIGQWMIQGGIEYLWNHRKSLYVPLQKTTIDAAYI